MRTNSWNRIVTLACAFAAAAVMLPQSALAHCDTMDGPVILAAKAALEQKEVTPVLKWVKEGAEGEIKTAFAKTLAVRTKGPEARDLADQFFFETLVRIHRAGEGAPFTGLKPAGTEVDPAVVEADRALDSGSVDKVVRLVTEETAAGIRRRFAEAVGKKTHAEDNVNAGREFVAAYVEYVHYVEALHQAAQAVDLHHEASPTAVRTEAAHHEAAPERNH